jgi:hypothetical protein
MFGFSPSTFNDPLDVNKIAGTNSREQAKLKSQAFLTDSQLGGAATGIFAQNKAEDIMAKAGASAQRTASNAAGISGLFNAAGSIGSFGAAGGFDGSAFNYHDKTPSVFGNFGGGINGQPYAKIIPTPPPPVPGLP